MQLLTELNEAGTTIVMVTHSEHDARYADRIIRMLDGQVLMETVGVTGGHRLAQAVFEQEDIKGFGPVRAQHQGFFDIGSTARPCNQAYR